MKSKSRSRLCMQIHVVINIRSATNISECFCSLEKVNIRRWRGQAKAITLKSYPTELSLTVLICLMGTLESTLLALAMEWGNLMAWSIQLDIKLLVAVYAETAWPGKGIGDHSHGWGSLMTLVKGPKLNLPWTNENGHQESTDMQQISKMSSKCYWSNCHCCWPIYVFVGASEDQPGSKSGGEKVIPTTQNMATMIEGIMTSNQEVVAVNVTTIKSTD
ncbi:wat1-related protein [Quercus suber]|uniref:Wat1-related protein n=1 Tax=Quercus suber TaxID=58331 RepID=A0AAW0KEK1_QUESU